MTGAVVISLASRRDRLNAFLERWNGSWLCKAFGGITVMHAVEPPDAGAKSDVGCREMACAVSHRTAVASAYASGLQRIAVFEDDAYPGPEPSGLMQALDSETKWQVCNLGGCKAQWRVATPSLRAVRLSAELLEVKGMVTTHAIIYNATVFEEILTAVPSAAEYAVKARGLVAPRAYDQWLGSLPGYVTGNAAHVLQDGSTSDILAMPHGQRIDSLIQETYEHLRRTCPVC